LNPKLGEGEHSRGVKGRKKIKTAGKGGGNSVAEEMGRDLGPTSKFVGLQLQFAQVDQKVEAKGARKGNEAEEGSNRKSVLKFEKTIGLSRGRDDPIGGGPPE